MKSEDGGEQRGVNEEASEEHLKLQNSEMRADFCVHVCDVTTGSCRCVCGRSCCCHVRWPVAMVMDGANKSSDGCSCRGVAQRRARGNAGKVLAVPTFPDFYRLFLLDEFSCCLRRFLPVCSGLSDGLDTAWKHGEHRHNHDHDCTQTHTQTQTSTHKHTRLPRSMTFTVSQNHRNM